MSTKKKMRIATICRCDNGGLGVQTIEFFENMRPEKTVLIDFGEVNGRPQFPDKYKAVGGQEIKINKGWLTQESIDWILKDIDVIFTCEIDYTEGRYELFRQARERGVKTVLQYNFEFLDYLQNPTLPLPDLLLSPRIWHFEEVRDAFSDLCQVEYLPVPVNRNKINFNLKKKARHFIHVAGSGYFEDRNGTDILLQSLFYIQSENIKVTIYAQNPASLVGKVLPADENGKIVDWLEIKQLDVANYEDLYKEGDVSVLPRRYGGLSLQLNEAMAAGMIPLMPNVEPQRQFLHSMSLTPICGKKIIQTKAFIECYDIDPRTLAMQIDNLAQSNKAVVEEVSTYSDMYANVISWENMLPKYTRLFESLLK